MTPPSLGHAVLKVGDLGRALDFYRDALELREVARLGDPDGLVVELYVDADPALWREDPAAVAHVGPLVL